MTLHGALRWERDPNNPCTIPRYVNTGTFFARPSATIFNEVIRVKEEDTDWECQYANQVH